MSCQRPRRSTHRMPASSSMFLSSSNSALSAGVNTCFINRIISALGSWIEQEPVRRLRLTRTLKERREEINRHRQEGRGVMFVRNFAHGLEEPELERDGFLADQRRRLHHFLRGLKFALRVDNL